MKITDLQSFDCCETLKSKRQNLLAFFFVAERISVSYILRFILQRQVWDYHVLKITASWFGASFSKVEGHLHQNIAKIQNFTNACKKCTKGFAHVIDGSRMFFRSQRIQLSCQNHAENFALTYYLLVCRIHKNTYFTCLWNFEVDKENLARNFWPTKTPGI